LGLLLPEDAPYQVRTYRNWEALIEAAPREAPSTAVLVDAFADNTLAPDPALRELLRVAPLLPVLASVDLSSACPEAVRTVLEWGVSGLVDCPLEAPPEALFSRLRDAHARPFKRRLDCLSRYASSNAVTLIRAAAEVSSDGGLSTDLAAIFGVTERTLSEWCAREALPPPRRLLAWTRVLLAIALLEEPVRTWRNVAQSTGYVNDRGLRRAIKTLLGEDKAPADPRQRTLAEAVKTFEGELFEHRERLRLARRPRRLATT
jgi:methylphosphotriester-DNA--protein-cysteine methyltransferase